MPKKPTVHTPFGDFQTKAALIVHLGDWLWSYKPGDAITDPETVKGLEFMIRQRKSKMTEIGRRKIVGWTVESRNKKSQCFAAVLEDATQLHFSFYKAVDRLFESVSENA